MLHTIQEAVKLTGKSRRSIYDHCAQGRVSYSVGDDGRRYFDTSELIRVYGPLRGSAHPEPVQSAQARTPTTEALEPLLAELRALRLEVAGLRETMMLIEHRPAHQEQPAPAESFADDCADVLAALRQRS